MSAKFLIIPDFALDDVKLLCSLTARQLELLAEALSDKSTARSEKQTYQLVAERLGVGYEDALGLLTAVRNLRRQRDRYDLSAEEVLEDLRRVLSPDDAPDESRSKLLVRLLERSEEDYFVEKLGSLKQALLPHLIDASTIVDLRPVFRQDRNAIEGILLVSCLALSTHDHATNEYQHVRVRLSRKDIDLLLEKLTDAKAKLTQIERTFKDYDLYE